MILFGVSEFLFARILLQVGVKKLTVVMHISNGTKFDTEGIKYIDAARIYVFSYFFFVLGYFHCFLLLKKKTWIDLERFRDG